MSKESVVLVLGAFVFFTPSLGVPNAWKDYMILGAGLLLMLIGYLLRRAAYLRRIDQGNGERATDTFVENTKPIEFDTLE